MSAILTVRGYLKCKFVNFQSLDKLVLNENAALEPSFQQKQKSGTAFTKLTFLLKNLMRHSHGEGSRGDEKLW